jgi:fucose permease
MLGCLLLGIHLFMFAYADSLWFAFAAVGFIGVGGGLIESGSNPLLVQLYPGRETAVLNMHHFFFAVGSLLGPLIMGAILTRSISWRWGYTGFGVAALLTLFVLSIPRIPTLPGKGGFEMKQMARLMADPMFLAFFLIIFLNSGVQNGIGFWMVSFLKETKQLPIALASLSLSFFFASLAGGRLLSSYFITRFHEAFYLTALLTLLFINLLLSILAPGAWTILFFALCGFAHSGVLPCLLGVAGRNYSDFPGTAMGLLVTATGLGSVLVPWLMSLVSQFTDLQTGFLSLEIFVAIALVLMGTRFGPLRKMIRSRSLA